MCNTYRRWTVSALRGAIGDPSQRLPRERRGCCPLSEQRGARSTLLRGGSANIETATIHSL